MSLTGSLKVTAKIVDYEADFVGIEMTLFKILVVTYTPKFYFKASVSMEYSVELKVTMGEIYDSDVGAWQNVSSSPTLESALEFSGELYIGIGGELGFSLFLDGFLTIAVELQMGAELTAKIKLDNPFSQPGSTIHSCNVCIDGELNGVVKVDLKSIILFNEKNLLGNTWKTKISDFFYCVDENEFGFTKCPHKVFRIKLTVRDSGGAPLEGASVWLYDREGNPAQVTLVDKDGTYIADDIPNTDKEGKVVFYLPNGEYQLEAVKDDQRRAMDITVHEEAKELSIGLTVQSGETAIRMVPEQLTLDVNAQEQLKVLFGNYRQALDVTNACVWSCGNPQVATVEKGKVTAVGPGTAAVVASYTKDGERYFVRCNVTVKGAAAFGKCGDNLYWSLAEDGTLTIFGSGEMDNYGPQNNAPELAPPWNSAEINLRTIVIEPGATSIGDYAFAWHGLTSVTIPSSVASIGKYAFIGCSKLTSATIPRGVTSIGEGAFCCSGLTNVAIPSSVTSIGREAFEGCQGLTSVTISEGVGSIGPYAFDGCKGLTSVTIPSSVTNISGFAFGDCDGLTSVTISEGVASIEAYAFFS